MIEFKDGPLAGQYNSADVVKGHIFVRLAPEQRGHLCRLEEPDQAVFIVTGRTEWLERAPALRPPLETCVGCGHRDGVAPEYRLVMGNEGEDPGTAWCGVCGRQLVYALQFDRRG